MGEREREDESSTIARSAERRRRCGTLTHRPSTLLVAMAISEGAGVVREQSTHLVADRATSERLMTSPSQDGPAAPRDAGIGSSWDATRCRRSDMDRRVAA